MIARFIKIIGIILIISFCSLSIFLATSERDIPMFRSGEFKYSYASFFEERFFDLRSKLSSNPKDNATDLSLLAIDDRSLNVIGRWPWSRSKIAQIIDKLSIMGAKVVAFDVFFSEPEIACNKDNPDAILKESIRNFQSKENHHVILPYSVNSTLITDPKELADENLFFKEAPPILLNSMLTSMLGKDKSLQNSVIAKKVFPIEELLEVEPALSHIETEPDSDGVFRHYPLVAQVDGFYLPSFGLQAYQLFSNDQVVLDINDRERIFLKTKNGQINVNFAGESKIRWLTGIDNIPSFSVLDFLNAKVDDPEMLKKIQNKIIFIGSTAFGVHDLRNLPIGSATPGVYFHMTMTDMLLKGRFFVPEEESIKISWLLLLVSTLVILFVMYFDNAIFDLLAVNFIIITLFTFEAYYLIPKGYNVRLFFCFLSVLLCYSWTTFINFYQSNKEKQKIKGTFSRYLAPSIINDLLKNPQKLKLGGEKKNITVFFSDVRDFTSISEKLTPLELTQCINNYMTMMTDTLFEHHGTLDKYIGDAMVAYWGAPIELENHAYHAVKASIQMIEKLPAINEQFKKDGFPEFKHGIGLNTGDCSVGNMGSNQIFSYTALGDNMNLGARLESLCKYYGVQLNISEYTKNAIPLDLQKEFKFRTLDKVKVKGKENAVTIFEVLHPHHPLYNKEADLEKYEQAFLLYQQEDFSGALATFRELNTLHPTDPSFERMCNYCEDYLKLPPPPGWDGSYTHKSK